MKILQWKKFKPYFLTVRAGLWRTKSEIPKGISHGVAHIQLKDNFVKSQ